MEVKTNTHTKMNTLMSIRTNILYKKKAKAEIDDDATGDASQFERYQEMIFLIDKPIYSRSNSGEIIRERGVEELRFVVSEAAYANMLQALTQLQTVTEEELG